MALTPSTPSNSFSGMSPLQLDSSSSCVSPALFSPYSPSAQSLHQRPSVISATSLSPPASILPVVKSESHDTILSKIKFFEQGIAASLRHSSQNKGLLPVSSSLNERRSSDTGLFAIPLSPSVKSSSQVNLLRSKFMFNKFTLVFFFQDIVTAVAVTILFVIFDVIIISINHQAISSIYVSFTWITGIQPTWSTWERSD